MKINRVRFIIGFGAFATASVAHVPSVRAQQLVEPRIFDLGNQGVLYRVRSASAAIVSRAYPRASAAK